MKPNETKAKILVVDDDNVTTLWLSALLGGENYTVEIAKTGNEALDRVRANPPDLILLDRVLPDLDGLEVCRRIRQEPNGAAIWVIMLTAKAGSDDIVSGLRAGADDYIPKRRGADVEVKAKARALLARSRRDSVAGANEPAEESHGQMVSFFSAKGGSGTTTLAVNTAYALQKLVPTASTLLVDMVFPLGSIGRMVGFESSETIAKLSQESRGRMDRKLIARYISPVRRYGFRVLLSAEDLQEAQALEVSQIAPLFNTLRGMFDYVLVDLGRSLSRITLPILENSDLIFVIVTPDVNAVALTKASLDYLSSLKISSARIAVIQNRTVPRSWLSKEDIVRELGLPVAVTIPYDGEQVPLATNAGVPYLERYDNSGTAVSMHEMARVAVERLKQS